MNESILKQLEKLPQASGVYFFRDQKAQMLYIGKAQNLKKRVYSYFQNACDLRPRLAKMIQQVIKIDFIITDSEIEALLLEAEMIKRYQPKYNVALKDDKSYLYLGITRGEDFPRVFFARKGDLEKIPASKRRGLASGGKADYFGPYTSADLLRKAVRFLRKIFPFRTCRQLPKKTCLWYHLGRCQGPCVGKISKAEYQQVIRQLKLFLKGKKKKVEKKIEKDMKAAAKQKNFETAAILRDRLFALKHLKNVWLATVEEKFKIPKRIECYDISNIMGSAATGSAVVFEGGQPDKTQYRKFKICHVKKISDYQMLAEVLERRFKHPEWPLPNLIIIDGGVGQLNIARKIVLEKTNLNIPIIAIAKGRDRSARRQKDQLFFAGKKILTDKKLIQRIRDEAHRFAIKYHRYLRSKGMLGK